MTPAEEKIIERLEALTNSITRVDERMYHVLEKYESLSKKQSNLKEEFKSDISQLKAELSSYHKQLADYKIELLKTRQELLLINQDQTNKIESNNDFKSTMYKIGWLILTSIVSVVATYYKMKGD